MSHNPYHSKQLRNYFDISCIGIDWYNSNNISFEFKETFSNNNIRKIIIKINNNQLDDSDYIIVCYKDLNFFVHKSNILKNKYKQNHNSNRTYIPYISLTKNYIYKTNNYIDLKNYLENLKK